jgi:guanylate kinase
MTHRGKLFFVSGPSGCGKTTLVNDLLASDKTRVSVVKTTTRKPRQGEVEGKDYHFVSEEEFERQDRENKFVASYRVYGHRYGTYRKEVEDTLSRGQDVVMVAGDGKVLPLLRKDLPNEDIVGIYLLPHKDEEKALAILAGRMRDRGDSEDAIAERIKYMREHPPFSEDYKFDHILLCFDEEKNRVLSPQEVLEKAEVIIAKHHNAISSEHRTQLNFSSSLRISPQQFTAGRGYVAQLAGGAGRNGSEAARII